MESDDIVTKSDLLKIVNELQAKADHYGELHNRYDLPVNDYIITATTLKVVANSIQEVMNKNER